MNGKRKLRFWLWSIPVVGSITAGLTLLVPSETGSAYWLGYSQQRLIIFGIHLVLLLAAAILVTKGYKHAGKVDVVSRIPSEGENRQLVHFLILGSAIFLSLAFFYELVFIPQGLAPIVGWFAYCAWVLFHIHRSQAARSAGEASLGEKQAGEREKPSKSMKTSIIVLTIIGVIYFCLFIPINLQGAETPHDFLVSGGDEYVMYPVVVKMLSGQESLRMDLYRFFVYGDYIYGFPFYGLSALLLLPSRWVHGADFASQTQINLFLLRQLISVLPYILSAFIFTYLATRLRDWLPSAGLFVLILTLPGAVQNNAQFWHPDSLNLLFIALTLYFLDRDALRFGRYFFLGAVACGLSVGTRLFGLFFFLAVAGLLASGIFNKVISIKLALVKGGLFCLLMAATILVTNPYLFNPGEYRAIQRLVEKKQVDLTLGYAEPDPEGVYRTGVPAWLPHMKKWYGNGLTLAVLGISALAGLAIKRNWPFQWSLFAWFAVIGGYMVFFVLVKSFQYMMPWLVPLYSAYYFIPALLQDRFKVPGQMTGWKKGVLVIVSLFLAGVGILQLVQNTTWLIGRIF